MHGGGTDYHTGLTGDEYGTLAKHTPYQHEHLTVGCFDKIVHSGEAWEGSRGCINFDVKKRYLNIF